MIRGVVIPKHEHEEFLALSNPSDILDLSRTHSVFLGLGRQSALDYSQQRAGYGRCDIQLLFETLFPFSRHDGVCFLSSL